MSYLVMRRGPNPGKLYQLTQDTVKVGRGSKNDIVIQDNEVSREHMQFVRQPSGYEVHDLESSNGTFINGQPVDEPWLLSSRCIIELGDSITLEYHLEAPEGARLEDNPVPLPLAPRPPKKTYLVVMAASQNEPTVYPLESETVKIGRDTANDIVIAEPEMSRLHLQLERTTDGYTAQDMGSTNGTLLNGENLNEATLLKTDDILQIGTMVQMQYTGTPERFIARMKTDVLARPGHDTAILTNPHNKKRTTSLADVPDILLDKPPEPTQVGTGVEQSNLGDQVLVSYHREDWEAVAPLVDKLQGADIGVWVDQYLIAGSNDWRIATDQARLECWLLVVVVSQKAMQSAEVRKNWRHFHNREKPIVLMIRESVERLPIGSSKLTRIHYNPAVPELAHRQLIEAITRAKQS